MDSSTGEKSIIIIDENQEILHKIGIQLTGKGYRLATSDTIDDALIVFGMREIPGIIFLSETIPGRQKLVDYIRSHKSHEISLIPILNHPPVKSPEEKAAVYRPYKAEDFLRFIQRLRIISPDSPAT